MHTENQFPDKPISEYPNIEENGNIYKTIFDNTHNLLMIINPNWIVLEVNRKAESWLGFNPDSLNGKLFFDLPFLDNAHDIFLQQSTDEAIRNNPVEIIVNSSKGTSFEALLSISSPDKNFFLISISDITDAKKSENLILEREKKYRSVVDNLKEVIFRTDAKGLWTFLNPAWEEITGFTVKESIGTNFLDYIHPDDRQRNMKLFLPLIEGEKSDCRHEIRYLTKQGGFRWIEVFAKLTEDQQNSQPGTTGTLMDITERKAMENQLNASRDYLINVIDSIPNPIYIINPEQVRSC